MKKNENLDILDIDLDFELEDKKYYVTLLKKRLKTKQGYFLYCDDIITLKRVHDDYRECKFKSKILNLVSSYIDFINSPENIQLAKEQVISYLRNDLLLYLDDESNEYFNFQQSTYMPLVNKFSKLFFIEQRLIPTTGLQRVNFDKKTLQSVNDIVDSLTLKELFVASFLIKISTSSILTLFFLKDELSIDEFFRIVFYAELDKQKKTSDENEEQRLNIIKDELHILTNFLRP